MNVSGTLPSQSVPARPFDNFIGKTLDGRYLIEGLLGEGGMGVVYRGRHKLIEKRVAIKVLRGDLAADGEMTERFLNEARAASSIGNPHIVDISDFGRLPEGATYFVMEYLDGSSLSSQMAQAGVIPVPRLVHIAKQIGRGLAAAHAAGIVHRDLKPDNVMLVARGEDRDFVKVLDFGIAKVGGDANRLTRAGSVFGTPHYMSPEQAAGVPVDRRTDIYALGVILYEMASGKVPFDADNFMGILTQHMYKSPAPIRTIVPLAQEIPPGLEAVVLKCLSKKVDLRYQSMEELVADLEKVERGMVPDAVNEMMGRSGGFNVPADYFRNSNRMAAATGAGPVRPAKAPVFWVAMASISAVVLVIVGVVVAASLRAAPKEHAGSAASVATVAIEAPSAEPATTRKEVVVTPDPEDAVVWLEDQRLGTGEHVVTIGPNEKLSVKIERAGYVTRTVTVDGSKRAVAVRLEQDVAKSTPPPVAKPAVKAAGSPPSAKTAATATTPPKATNTPAAPAATGGRPSNCAFEDWDPFEKKCKR
ncbi:serine/threonine protein kinase [Labilithrix luteola]|uniref:non-specific serine/threonine protein kinase n=1 Tax=Labilithrix luteola TaxID=1391654 RepID=A0A0K1Q245_9BACT|nr:serine/threonine protein kinase [Labilithrix luteola]